MTLAGSTCRTRSIASKATKVASGSRYVANHPLFLAHRPRKPVVGDKLLLCRNASTGPSRNTQPPGSKSARKAANLDTQTPSAGAKAEMKGTPRGLFGLGPITLALLVLGLTVSGWAGYKFYYTETLYPPPVRAYLKVAIRATMDNDWAKAEAASRKAWEVALSLSPSEFKEDPHLKITGIAAKLGEILESQGKTREAYIVYVEALSELFPQFALYGTLDPDKDFSLFGTSNTVRHPDWSKLELGGKARLRAVGLANRAATLAQGMQRTKAATTPPVTKRPQQDSQRPDGSTSWPPTWTKSWEEIELQLRSFSVTQVLYLTSNTTGIPTSELSTSPDLDTRLPRWLSRMDLAGTCEGLAECYVRRGNIELALALYQTTFQFLLSSKQSMAFDISTAEPLLSTAEAPNNAMLMCMAAGVLTAMGGAVLGTHGPNAGSKAKPVEDLAQKNAVRSWCRESRHLVDAGRRLTGGTPYHNLMRDIQVLGRADKPNAKEIKALDLDDTFLSSLPDVPTQQSTLSDMHVAQEIRDKRLLYIDLKRIQEAGRRKKEAVWKSKTEGPIYGGETPAKRELTNADIWGAGEAAFKTNPLCERTWAAVLYNTGMVEMLDHNPSLAEQYFHLALEHSRRINFLEGVTRSKEALKDLPK